MRLLVVEDEEKLAGIVARSLKSEGFAVDVAADGERGLGMATSCAYDAIILDIMLPKLSGTAILQSIRQKYQTIPPIRQPEPALIAALTRTLGN
jgi:two-component system OmpR family response regulator